MINFAMASGRQLAGLLAFILLTTAAQAQWEEYQFETFDSTETIFPTGAIGEATGSVDSQGRYVINGMNTGKDSLSAIRDNVSFYRVSTDCEILSSTAGELAFCGLLFHYGKRPGSDLPSYYVFYAYGDGFYGVKRIVDGGKSDVIIPLAATELLDAGQPNSLAVEARGNRFELYINGEQVNSFTDMKLDGGGYGVYISKFSIAAFDNFEVQLEPAPARPAAQPERNAPARGIKPLDIPRNPNRPLYPWEVGYDKDPKKKKRQHDSERRADDTRTDKAAGPTRTQSRPKSTPASQSGRSKPALKRDTASRRGDDGFIADEEQRPATPARAERSGSLREQYRESRGAEPAPVMEEETATAPAEPAPTTPSVELPGEPVESEPAVELLDEPVTDTGEALPDADEEVLYRRAAGFEEASETAAGTSRAVPDPGPPAEPARETAAAGSEPTAPRRGLRISGDDWEDRAAVTYTPKRRLPPSEREPAEPAVDASREDEPPRAIASDGSPVAVETVPLDGNTLRDPELEAEAAEPEPEPVAPARAEARLLEPVAEPEPEPVSEFELPGLPAGESLLEQEAPAPTPAPAAEPPAPSISGGIDTVAISDDFTSQQVWQTQDLPTSSYQYAEGGYAINNVNASTMAISYQQDNLSDFALSVEARHTGGADYVGYGVAGRFVLEYEAGRPLISYYGLFISRSGEFMLLKVVRGVETVLRDWQTSPLVNLGGTNTVELRLEGAQLTALINGSVAATTTDGTIGSGGYALLAGPGIAALFDNLELTGVRAATPAP